MDIYAQPHSVASVVWMQQAPHDPRRKKLGVIGIHTTYAGEREYAEPSGITARGFGQSSTRTGLATDEAKAAVSRTLGDSRAEAQTLPPPLYATGDVGVKSRNAGNLTSGSAAGSDDVARVSDQRIRLLSARYGKSNTSAEILARLAILDTRLAEKAPLVSREQLDVLEQNLDLLATLQKNRKAIANRFTELAKL